MATRNTKALPPNGDSRDALRGHLTKIAVWKLLFLYIHGTHDRLETHRRLERIGVEVELEEVGQLADLAFPEAEKVGK